MHVIINHEAGGMNLLAASLKTVVLMHELEVCLGRVPVAKAGIMLRRRYPVNNHVSCAGYLFTMLMGKSNLLVQCPL